MVTGLVIMMVASVVAYVAHYTPKVFTNHLPHLILPQHLADRLQHWLES